MPTFELKKTQNIAIHGCDTSTSYRFNLEHEILVTNIPLRVIHRLELRIHRFLLHLLILNFGQNLTFCLLSLHP